MPLVGLQLSSDGLVGSTSAGGFSEVRWAQAQARSPVGSYELSAQAVPWRKQLLGAVLGDAQAGQRHAGIA